MSTRKNDCEIGLIGLGTMGRNLAQNIADQGFAVAAKAHGEPCVAYLGPGSAGH
ncbi:MAG: hypothetical protein FJ135_04830 [Deltaproteobacteria bacterium]|nr:hypothetical protein [Deltaproteobacteria bacterium]